ncbi:hypothetical protein FT663_01617 [Candidozyma haemuli var. vulneris]|uniref:SET domain-containing protein n=1 Tax=Candidozyma haemuli TaxID=45357 RepID=A0A2V1B0Z1_9ASCO|nr:hypothetical protein CXQ85_004119 [[Candida] haemuloni]KAF3994117.1 hypothetical protein FT663_01617 [[Candida] haemuloni var. vulneris]KAF3994283.1 hypothetical protein FT662_00152 [[Candida] haemuloni var. vulneris]PVH23825.1 hypothetical protein CXQ85_004119 [[Candida] haemuloni]
MASLEALLSWAKKKGSKVSSEIEFKESSDSGNAAYVSKDIKSAQIKIPVSIALKLSDAIEGFGSEFEDLVPKTKNINTLLKLFLAYERVPENLDKSTFKAYIASLPQFPEMRACPYLWSPEETAQLKGSNLGSSLRENIANLVEEWWSIINILPESIEKPKEHFINMKFYYEQKFHTDEELHGYIIGEGSNFNNWTSFPSYLWASMIFKSRSFPGYLLKDSASAKAIDYQQEDSAVLLPVIDLLNHNPSSEVFWSVKNDQFVFETKSPLKKDEQLFNNYGQKGNEELLLAYGFCIDNNEADSVALKVKVPLEMLPELEANGMVLPKISDYTTSVVTGEEKRKSTNYEDYKDGLLFFITKKHVPENLILLFQWLVKSKWEKDLSLRMRLSGLNHLRQAVESKAGLLNYSKLPADSSNPNTVNTRIYLKSQKKILDAAVKHIKHMEKALLDEKKNSLLTLKGVYKRDHTFVRSLLLTMGVTSWEDIVEKQLMDQIWLLYLIRCYNRDEYIKTKKDEEQNYLPEWIKKAFQKMDAETEMDAAEVVQFRQLYENMIIPMNSSVPEIYNKGKWTVRELIVSTKLLDTIGFVRGKEQECILVAPE